MLIAHLSDPHLCPPGRPYQSVLDTTPRFAEALMEAAAHAPDLLILSGDLSEHGDPESYPLPATFLRRFPARSLPSPATTMTGKVSARASLAFRTLFLLPRPARSTPLPRAPSA
jgi:3',5'-cyclic AMP phosphodiesterase CpdA